MTLEIKGILNVNLVEGTVKLLGAFRAYYTDPRLSWSDMPI